MEEYEEQRWIVLHDDIYDVVMPEWDVEMHATEYVEKDGEKTAELAGASCPCGPRIKSGDERGVWERPTIIHNSFRDKRRVEESLKMLE